MVFHHFDSCRTVYLQRLTLCLEHRLSVESCCCHLGYWHWWGWRLLKARHYHCHHPYLHHSPAMTRNTPQTTCPTPWSFLQVQCRVLVGMSTLVEDWETWVHGLARRRSDGGVGGNPESQIYALQSRERQTAITGFIDVTTENEAYGHQDQGHSIIPLTSLPV